MACTSHNSIEISLLRFPRGNFNIGVHGHVKHIAAWKLKTFRYIYVCAHRETNGKVHTTRVYIAPDSVFNSRTLSQGVIVLGPFPINPPRPPICLVSCPCSISHPSVCSISDLLRPSSGTPLRYHNIRVQANENGCVPRGLRRRGATRRYIIPVACAKPNKFKRMTRAAFRTTQLYFFDFL